MIKYLLIAVAVIGLLFAISSCGHRDGVADERERMAPVIQSYKDRIKALLVQLDEADVEIAKVNAQVDQLKIEADEREKASKAAVKAARTLADRYRLRASQIAAARPTGDQCVAAASLIRETLAEERR